MVDFSTYDVVVVGCGLTGSVIARYMAETMGKSVLVLERRNHIAGNMYDYQYENGLRVQQYGPHTFHTTKKPLFDFMCKYADWEEYYVTCMAEIDGKSTPSPFNFQTIDDFFSEEKAEKIKEHIRQEYGNADKATIVDMLNSQDSYVKAYADFLFEKDYSLYTAKQWGISPQEIDVSVLKRVPVLFSYKTGYFDDKFQAMPKQGFTQLIGTILNHKNITVKLEIEAKDYVSIDDGKILLNGMETEKVIVYTGAADELLDCKYGALPYRSLRFDFKEENTDSYQDAPIVAYPQADAFTRITEYSKMPVQETKGKTVIAVEYPQPYEQGISEPYYPILTEDSKALYQKYQDDLSEIPNLYLCGRLADFKYYNMDQALERALEICDILEKRMSEK